MRAILILLSLILIVPRITLAKECSFKSKARIITKSEHELHQVWIEVNADSLLSSKLPDSPSLLNYLSLIKSKISDVRPFSLLKKEYDDFTSADAPGLQAEAPNMLLTLTNQAGELRPMNCLEGLLLSQQTDRGLSWNQPMEFSSFVLRKNIGPKTILKIYFSTNDRPGGKINSDVMNLISTDLSRGWILWRHIHNHNFNIPVSKSISLVGAPSPGLTDVDLYRQLNNDMGLKSATVTNGFDTLEIDQSAFEIFHAH